MPFPIAGSLHSMKNPIPPSSQSQMAFLSPIAVYSACATVMFLSWSPAWRPGPVQPDPNAMLLLSEWHLLSCLRGCTYSLWDPRLSEGLNMSAGAEWWPQQQPRIISVALFSVIIQKGKQKKSFKNAACALPVQQRISWKSFIFLNDIIMYALFCFHHFYHHFLAEAQVTWLG